jgi:predicted Zn-dependent protease with MMP-like domain/Tfp pilus assembly protein PilF
MKESTKGSKANHRLSRDLDRGWDLLEAGELAQAHRLAEGLRARAPESPDVLLLLAACARAQEQDDEALQFLESAIALDPDWAEPELFAAELLAERDELEEALEHARSALSKAGSEEPAGPDRLNALALTGGLQLDLERPGEARETLSRLPPAGDAQASSDLAREIAQLFLDLDEAEDARGWFERAVALDEQDADAWHGMGLAAELTGDEPAKRQAWLQTLDLDAAQDQELPELLSEKQAADVAESALAELPAGARRLLANIPILITDRPARADVETGLDPRLLGLFAGTAYPEVSSLGGTPHLTQILLFRRNLERVAFDEDELRAEIRTTLLHETGHFFGLSEEDLHHIGLG